MYFRRIFKGYIMQSRNYILYNSEIVSSSEGVLLQNNKDECLVQAILLLDKNRDLLNKYKTGNLASADFYYIEKYVEGITQQIRGGTQ